MHITLESDYAVRIVIFLAKQDHRIETNTIAENTGVTLRFALKILRNLVACGIVKSYKGTKGGYELNRSPEEITLRDILKATEGEYNFSRCLKGNGVDCSHPNSSECKVQEEFLKISNTVRKMLGEVTIKDVM